MPTSSFSEMASWGAYLAAAASLVLIMAPPLSEVATGSRTASASRTVDGVGALIDELRPGLSVNFSFGSSGSQERVVLDGRLVTCWIGDSMSAFTSTWMLGEHVLAPGVLYSARLENGSVEVDTYG